MNSYPVELLAQHVPLMFVAGLDVPQIPDGPQPSSPVRTTLRRPSGGVESGSSGHKFSDPFAVLISRLREALTVRQKGVVWEPNRGKTFHVVLVDKAVRFPPRKLYPSAASGRIEDTIQGTAHSPLSPLTPSSPVFPDGLIAPIWVRKHMELVPSVFVLFLRLWEGTPPKSPLEARDGGEREEERRRDADLANEIAARKKITGERGIKLTVVLMASRRILDDPALDGRLTFIRRQSGLDSRAALFVLSPVSQSELGDFVRSLQDALYDSAVEYYTSNSKRVRRKRNRNTHTSVYAPVHQTPSGGRPLRSQGWAVRYEYKMATFAEFRAEDEVARKHYEDCWTGLVDMFGSTAILPPRTKRWAEAKVLADCVTIKICKLYLYYNEHALAMAHFNRHLSKFSELSRGWGIGEETFEFWSWTARQYRILAEMLEMGLRSTLRLPSHVPSPLPAQASTPPVPGQPPVVVDALRTLGFGLNPANALQHPGFYYFAAATCTQQRYERYLGIVEQESRQPGSMSNSPGFANEKKVDHQAVIIELFTKSYELFKKYKAGQSRLTYYIAYRIAETYHAAGKYDLAVRFFERIAKSFREERWGSMLRPMLSKWYECAQQLKDVDLTVRLLIEMLGSSGEDATTLEEDLVAILKSTSPSTTDSPFVVDLPESDPIFDTSVVFWQPEVAIDEPATFQLLLAAPKTTVVSQIPFASARIEFGDNRPSVLIKHVSHDSPPDAVQLIDLGDIPVESAEELVIDGDLRWPTLGMKVFTGSISSSVPQELSISKMVLNIKEGNWNIDVPFNPNVPRTLSPPPPRWLSSLGHPPRFIPIYREHLSSTKVRPRPHALSFAIKHSSPAYIDEEYPIVVEITSHDEREFDITVDMLLQPPEDNAVNHIVVENEQSSGLIKGIAFGTLRQGETLSKTVYLFCSGVAGERTLDISVQSRASIRDGETASLALDTGNTVRSDTSEHLETITVIAEYPFQATFGTVYQRPSEPLRPITELDGFTEEIFEGGVYATVTAKIEAIGNWEVEVESLKHVNKDVPRATLMHCSLDADAQDLSGVWQPGDVFSALVRYNLSLDDTGPTGTDDTIPSPGLLEITWRRASSNGKSATSQIPFPALYPSRDGLVALLDAPASARLHTPFPLRITIQNRHAFRTADVQLQLEPSEAFVVAGIKQVRIGVLMPGAEERITFVLIPLLCGRSRLPNFRILDRRRSSGRGEGRDSRAGRDSREGSVNGEERERDAVEVVDVRWDARDADGKILSYHTPDLDDLDGRAPVEDDGVVVLVTP